MGHLCHRVTHEFLTQYDFDIDDTNINILNSATNSGDIYKPFTVMITLSSDGEPFILLIKPTFKICVFSLSTMISRLANGIRSLNAAFGNVKNVFDA